MNRSFSSLLIFLLGAAAGAVATRYFLQEEYCRKCDEYTRELKDLYDKRAFCKDKIAEIDRKQAERAAARYSERVVEEGYAKQPEPPVVAADEPYVIKPEEFGELDNYSTVTLYWYQDDILADEYDEEVDDIPEIIGDALTHFGEYEDDAVYVRNDAKRCDYEVLISLKNFADIS